MRKTNFLIFVVALMFLVPFLFPPFAFAYVDPGTGSYVLQLVLAFVFGGLFGVKMYWKKIKSIFVKSEKKKEDDTDGEK